MPKSWTLSSEKKCLAMPRGPQRCPAAPSQRRGTQKLMCDLWDVLKGMRVCELCVSEGWVLSIYPS